MGKRKPKISIAIAYYNRKQLLINTIKSIMRTAYPLDRVELVICDDGSNEENNFSYEEFYPYLDKGLEVIYKYLNPSVKTWSNPCVPYNIAFKWCTGSIIIIQNPESAHLGDIISHAAANVSQGVYIPYACYASTPSSAATITASNSEMSLLSAIQPIGNYGSGADGGGGWYNHSKYRPVGYHFCSAISKQDLTELGGFDQSYAAGVCFDDDEFFHRIKLKGLRVSFVDFPFVVHQYHAKPQYVRPDFVVRVRKNERLFKDVTLNRKDWKAMK